MKKGWLVLTLIFCVGCSKNNTDSIEFYEPHKQVFNQTMLDNLSDTFHQGMTNEDLIYPDRPLYPTRFDDVSQVKENHGRIRITTFTSPDSPESILKWYRIQLLTAGWQDKPVTVGSAAQAAYSLTRDRLLPAFGMEIHVTRVNAVTTVTLTHVFSGPFSAQGWPED